MLLLTQEKVNNKMHIPDGFLSPSVVITAFIITIIFWAISFKKIKLTDKQVPIMGLLTALFFAAMMMNYPIVGGTTAHLLGGASLGLILGPFAGCISVTIILVLQALLFGDGGLTTLGANVLNMGIIGVFVPCALFLVMNKVLKGNRQETVRHDFRFCIRRRRARSHRRRHRIRLFPTNFPVWIKRSCTRHGNQPFNNRRCRRHSHNDSDRHTTETATRRLGAKPHPKDDSDLSKQKRN